MEIIVEVIMLYSVWALLDFANFYMINTYFLQKERKPASCVRYIWVGVMFLVSYVYGLQYAGILYNKIFAVIIYIPFLYKIIPVIWSYHEVRKRDILLVTCYQLLVATISQCIYAFVNNSFSGRFYELFVYHICEIITVAVIALFLGILLICRRNNILRVYFEKLTIGQYVVFFLALCGANFIEAKIILLYNDDSFLKVLSVFNVVIICVLLVMIIIVRESDSRRGIIINLLNEHMKKVTQYYNELIEKDIETKKFRHDIKNLLFVLGTMIEQGENEKALEYIEKMNGLQKDLSIKYDTGNLISDTLLSSKAILGKKNNTEISFNGYIPSRFENVDLVILLSNILDNALDACEKIEGIKKITIESILKKKMWILEVKNPTSKDVAIFRNRISTTKSNKEIHGYGLMNIEKIAQKYDGNLSLECKDREFTVRAMLHLNQS